MAPKRCFFYLCAFAGAYVPGTATAPVLLVVAGLLLWRWTSEESAPPAR